ncbi:hypothetical protein J2S78_002096 [Salibacterium salarium]|uniref:DUF6906 family protein n=1 Tax=Salibacterium salarium TaxID=284579 RepID=UPI00277DDEE1|nr:hypothetical protein [Salibacterium salarium]MDQ0299676.1 hypothetical protein [Salibacterium salarium]
MQQGKKPTRAQKERIAYFNLNPDNWLVTKNNDGMLLLKHRYTEQTREIPS